MEKQRMYCWWNADEMEDMLMERQSRGKKRVNLLPPASSGMSLNTQKLLQLSAVWSNFVVSPYQRAGKGSRFLLLPVHLGKAPLLEACIAVCVTTSPKARCRMIIWLRNAFQKLSSRLMRSCCNRGHDPGLDSASLASCVSLKSAVLGKTS